MPFFFTTQIIITMSSIAIVAIIGITAGLFGFLGFLGYLAYSNNVKNLKKDYLVIESQKANTDGGCNIRLCCEANKMLNDDTSEKKVQEPEKSISKIVKVGGIGQDLKG